MVICIVHLMKQEDPAKAGSSWDSGENGLLLEHLNEILEIVKKTIVGHDFLKIE